MCVGVSLDPDEGASLKVKIITSFDCTLYVHVTLTIFGFGTMKMES